jgi:hypothetical protein
VKWLKRSYKHLIYWGVLIVYLLAAYPIYTAYFIKNGKPVGTIAQIPQATSSIIYNLVELRPVVYQGENLYELKGFAFLQDRPTQVNKITIILSTNNQNIAFSTNSVPSADMIKSYANFKPGMEPAEFSMLISKEVLNPGLYRIGVLLDDTQGSGSSYVLTGSSIKQTPNTLSFIPGQ